MAKRKFKFPKIKVSKSENNMNIKVDITMQRFERNFESAQYLLDSNVMSSMVPFMPMRDGVFINVTKSASAAMAGSGYVCAAAPPFGRFLYEGKVMVDPLTGSPWARKGAKKIVTDRPLDYDKTRHPYVTDHWFYAAKSKDGKKWVRRVKKSAGRD